MASADFLQIFSPYPLYHGVTDVIAGSARPPRVSVCIFIPCNHRIYCMKFGQYWTLLCLASSSAHIQPYTKLR